MLFTGSDRGDLNYSYSGHRTRQWSSSAPLLQPAPQQASYSSYAQRRGSNPQHILKQVAFSGCVLEPRTLVNSRLLLPLLVLAACASPGTPGPAGSSTSSSSFSAASSTDSASRLESAELHRTKGLEHASRMEWKEAATEYGLSLQADAK